MPQNILITGASGYLGGTILARWKDVDLTGYDKLFALVRKPEQAEAVKNLYGAEPLIFDPADEDAVREAITKLEITIVVYFLDAYHLKGQINFIKGLAVVRKKTGQEVHFIYTTGAKQFSSLAGAPTDQPLPDNDPHIYQIHKSQKSDHQEMTDSIHTNTTVVDEGEKHHVRTYLIAPCIVYGKGEGFGNKISIQTVDIVSAAKGVGKVYKVKAGRPEYPVCHLIDTVRLYLLLLKSILNNENPGYGKNGFYLASAGNIAWDDLYAAIAKSLANRGIIDDDHVKLADDQELERMAVELGVPESSVEVKMSGRATFTPEHARSLGWKAQYPPEHAIEAADDEVANILENMNSAKKGTH